MINHRENLRLCIVGAGFALVTLGLWVRLVHVQVLKNAYYTSRAAAQSTLERDVPATRGCVFDRSGSPLALNARKYAVAVQPRLVEDREAVVTALSECLPVSKRTVRDKLGSRDSYVYVIKRCDLDEQALEKIKTLVGVAIEPRPGRVYSYENVAAKVIGLLGEDGRGMSGIEAALDRELRGIPGREKIERDGSKLSRELQTLTRREPVNGKHVYLTIDARLQEIAEIELAAAIDTAGATGGTVLIMDCRTGEILALAEFPSPEFTGPRSQDVSLWTLRSVSCVYEPGSTFKLVTAAGLLEKSKVRSADWFDAENGKADLGVATVRDAERHGPMTFRDGFVKSSNIVMAKAAQRLSGEDFLAIIRLFGFGSPTGVELPGESAGQVAPKYSKRTHITLAYGHEIAVTPLQLANAFSAVANGGVLLMPRIVRAIQDDATGTMIETRTVAVRRVVSAETAARLREYCRGVVKEGTGKQAELGFIEVAGKTGTAQKVSARGGYEQDRFVSSFVGFAPASDPKVVCLVILDEPDYEHRLGGVCAAPVFANVIGKIATSSHLFDDSVKRTPAERDSVDAARIAVPNFLRMNREAVMECARKYDLNLLCKGDAGDVIAQDPDPGVTVDRDEVLRVYLSGSTGKFEGNEVPDLTGLAVRAARRAAAEAGFKCEISGSGCVVSQHPAPGVVSNDGVVRVECGDPPTKRKAG